MSATAYCDLIVGVRLTRDSLLALLAEHAGSSGPAPDPEKALELAGLKSTWGFGRDDVYVGVWVAQGCDEGGYPSCSVLDADLSGPVRQAECGLRAIGLTAPRVMLHMVVELFK